MMTSLIKTAYLFRIRQTIVGIAGLALPQCVC